jgi:hypothetical protein
MAYTPWEQTGGLFFDIILSSETKRPGVNGCICWEYDTGKRFIWEGSAWVESQGGGVVKTGVVTLGAGGSSNVAFAIAFPTLPRVVCTSQFATTDTSTTLSCHSVTVNGFVMKGAGNAAGVVAWIASNADS